MSTRSSGGRSHQLHADAVPALLGRIEEVIGRLTVRLAAEEALDFDSDSDGASTNDSEDDSDDDEDEDEDVDGRELDGRVRSVRDEFDLELVKLKEILCEVQNTVGG